MNRIVPTSLLDESQEPSMARLIRELCDIPSDQWSPRETRIMNSAIAHGELYHANVTRTPNGLVIKSDLGDPDSVIELTVPLTLNEKKVLEIFQKLAEELAS